MRNISISLVVFAITFLLLFIFALVSLIILGGKKTKDTIQLETDSRAKKQSNTNNAMSTHNRIFRSRRNKIILGLCGGLAEYFNIDPALTRIGAVLLALISGGVVILVYLVCGIIIPSEPENA